MLTRLPQAGSSQDGRVHAEDDGIDSSSKEISQDGNPEDERSIKAPARTLNTGGQHENPKTDDGNDRKDKGSDKY